MFIRTENFSQYVRAYPVVTFLLALNIGIFIYTLIPGIGDRLFLFGLGDNLLIANGEYWRLITPMFLHGGFMHLLFNMFSLFVFGPELEKIAGKARFITVYLLAGLFGDIATYFVQPVAYTHVGASGAIFGVFGAFGALVYYTKHAFPQLRQVILPIIIISVVMTFVGTNINVTAHIAGLLTGFLIGLSFFNPKNIVSWRKK
ncbi:rhomboid family intramembrane serine protease [Sporosarcina sp. P21c]|uniref:rhomboid family intramembrane serine protease n=1 Tax=Sporosarcina TaxID=1569 RepID=UPI000A165C77|nr:MULTISPECIES: rhomboid family intramembrane serine protease [Sporosarcina]ARJ38684.1 rhomboid family intramembrane serine protease [Sporosarcina ureae]PIC65800.1 rhomboid family intramembrane serine protease [Sporosarcina sp. P16a]PIC81836.1 rhomboid family intramembrane serine protease [Sporosarcina sp. P1]PIC87481.1 rhomboid family intramembrane serine protease [Sporosarcina sp. P21c]PIC91405.1 rhomboid family intramembrane serine protease [Sporosarcina sp. P25]